MATPKMYHWCVEESARGTRKRLSSVGLEGVKSFSRSQRRWYFRTGADFRAILWLRHQRLRCM